MTVKRVRKTEDILVSVGDDTFRFEAERKVWKDVPEVCAGELLRTYHGDFAVVTHDEGDSDHE